MTANFPYYADIAKEMYAMVQSGAISQEDYDIAEWNLWEMKKAGQVR